MNERYYTSNAYNSRNIPDQRRQISESNRPWFNRKLDMRLPWGLTEDVAPLIIRRRKSPEVLRRLESEPQLFDANDFHQKIDHETYRHAKLGMRTKILLFVSAFGNFYLMGFILFILFLTYFVCLLERPGDVEVLDLSLAFLYIFLYIFIPIVSCRLVPDLLMKFVPKLVIIPSKKPEWQLSRRTGMVTIYRKDKARGFSEEQLPFYEFDAYVTNEFVPPGQVVHMLYLAHRYRPVLLPIGDLIGKTRGEECFALWDMFQNFMDTSRPLPDIPLWEEHRLKDPVTAEHDRRTGRPPRYWRDMDDETWEEKEDEMMSKVMTLTTIYRPNLMREHVQYAR